MLVRTRNYQWRVDAKKGPWVVMFVLWFFLGRCLKANIEGFIRVERVCRIKILVG